MCGGQKEEKDEAHLISKSGLMSLQTYINIILEVSFK